MSTQRVARPDPRKVGGVYASGYCEEVYTVTAIHTEVPVWGVQWTIESHTDGSRRTHSTPWDWKRDRIVSEPSS